MAKMLQNNFSSGELSPVLSGRSDLAAYYKGVAEAENFVVTKEGTLRKRRGFVSVSEAPYDLKAFTRTWTGVSGNQNGHYCVSGDGYVSKFSSTGMPVAYRKFSSISFSDVNVNASGHVMAIGKTSGGNPYFALSTDGGSTWTNGAFSDTPVGAIGAVCHAGDKWHCETVSGEGAVTVWTTSDGTSWSQHAAQGVGAIATSGCVFYEGSTSRAYFFSGEESYVVSDGTTVSVVAGANPWTCGCKPSASVSSSYLASNGFIDACTVSNGAIALVSSAEVDGEWKWMFATSANNAVAIGESSTAYFAKNEWRTPESVPFDVDCACHVGSGIVVATSGSDRYTGSAASVSTWSKRSVSSGSFRIFPYRYDRTSGGFILFRGRRVYFCDKTGEFRDWQGASHDEDGFAYASFETFAGTVEELQCKQVGDQLWLSNGYWNGIVSVHDNASLTTSSWAKAEKPDKIPCYVQQLTGTTPPTPSDFDPTEKLIPGSGTRPVLGTSVYVEYYSTSSTQGRKAVDYACCGVSDSVHSTVCKGTTRLSLTWEAGNFTLITASVLAADIDKYDSIIVGKVSGSSMGILAQFYMTDTPYRAIDTAGHVCYRHDDGNYYDAETGGNPVTLKFVQFRFKDENHTPSDIVYDQTDTLGEGFSSPLCMDCYQQRRVFANASANSGDLPMTLWFSEVGNIDNFWANRPVGAADPFSPTISSTGPAFIRFVITYGESLVMFTDAGVYAIGFSQASGGFSSSTCRISKVSDALCCSDVHPIVTDTGIVFVGADRKSVFTVAAAQNGALEAVNRSVLVEHLTRKDAIVAMAHQLYPDNTVWFATESGKLLSLTLNKDENVCSWAHSAIQDCKVRDIVGIGTCTDGNNARTYSDLVLVVERGESTYVCRMADGYADAIGGTTSNVVAKMTTMRPESQQQTIVGMRKNVKDLVFRLYESGKVKVRPAEGAGPVQELALCSTRNAAGYTGDAKVMPRGYVNDDGQVTVVSDDGNPCEILSVATELEVA